MLVCGGWLSTPNKPLRSVVTCPAEPARGLLGPHRPRCTGGLDGSSRAMPEVRGSSVLITRPQPGASETAARVASLGFLPIIAPVIRIEPTPAHLPAAAALA